MAYFLQSLFTDPLYYLGIPFAVATAAGFGYWAAGFLSEAHHLFDMSGKEEYLEWGRRMCTQGIFIMLYVFIIWEVVRWIAAI